MARERITPDSASPPIAFISRDDVEHATRVVREELHRTPILALGWLAELGVEGVVHAKLETRQIMGSFKTRGALSRMSCDDVARHHGVVAASAGNHGLGVAWVSRVRNIPATIVVPESAPLNKRERIAELANLIVAPYPGYNEAERYAKALARSQDALFVSSYDDPKVAAGNGATLAREILEDLPRCDCIIVPVGGGGLCAGVARYLELAGQQRVAVVGVQSEATSAMAQSFASGRAVLSLPPQPTLAEGLEGGVSPRTFEVARRLLAELVTVSETSIGRAMALAFKTMGEVVEGSAAVVLAALLEHKIPSHYQQPCVLLSGRNVDARVLDAQLVAHFGPQRKMG